MGARQDHARVVHDRNRLTGGGVTAGLDFALTLATLLRGKDAAERVALIVEYAPQPPFQGGSPDRISPQNLAQVRQSRGPMDQDARRAAQRAALRLGIM